MVDISPEANIFGIFRSLNYQPWYALAEFVDNSISSWETWEKQVENSSRPQSVRVYIEIDSSAKEPFIEIRDSGTGIAFKDFDRAFKVASIPPDKTGLNEFGMGMKTAGFWFSNNWIVRTSYVGDPVARTMRFNLARILGEQTKDITPIETPSSEAGHFTTVRLTELNQIPKGKSVGKLKAHLTDIYRCFLRDGSLELFYNNERLSFEAPEILKAPKVGVDDGTTITWTKDVHFELSSGKMVKGFAGIREKGSTDYAGFALFRKKRLIIGSGDQTFRPHEIFGMSNSFAYQRVFGELHLTGFEVSHTKDAIKWGDGEQEEFTELLRNALIAEPMNILSQADRFRKTAKPEPRTVEKALEAVKEVIEAGLPAATMRLAPKAADLTAAIPEILNSKVSPAISDREVSLDIDTGDHGLWQINLRGVSDEALSKFFDIGSKREGTNGDGLQVNKLDVLVNLSHPFATNYLGPNLENSELLFAFTSCLCISLALGSAVGAKSNYIVDYMNDILRFKDSI